MSTLKTAAVKHPSSTGTAITLDASDNVGIGTAAGSAPLHVEADSSALSLRVSGRSSDDRSDVEFYENDNTTRLSYFINEPTYSYWNYGTRTIYTGADTHIIRDGSGTEIARLDGDGLKFNGDTAATNALDDYESGSWTPTYSGGVTSPSYNNTYGSYVKVGDLVSFTFRIQLDGGTANSYHLTIAGLPFTSGTQDVIAQGGCFINYQDAFRTDQNFSMHIAAGQTTITFYTPSTGGVFTGTSANDIQATLHVNGFYFTD